MYTRKNHPLLTGCLVGGAFVAAIALAPLANSQTATADAEAKSTIVRVNPSDKTQQVITTSKVYVNEDGKSQTFELTMEGDKIRVLRNGKEVPTDHLMTEDGRIIITDESGNRVHAVTLSPSGHAGYFTVAGNMLMEAEQPKVMIGIHMVKPDVALLHHLGIEKDSATLISGVYEGLPAYEAGLGEYDVITTVNGKPATDADTVRAILAELEPGDEVTFTVIQTGKRGEVTVKAAPYDSKAMAEAKLIGSAAQENWLTAFGAGDSATFAWKRLMESPQVFVAPNEAWGQSFEQIAPHLGKFHEMKSPQLFGDEAGLNDRLRRLDERLQELEKVLERLLEKQSNR